MTVEDAAREARQVLREGVRASETIGTEEAWERIQAAEDALRELEAYARTVE